MCSVSTVNIFVFASKNILLIRYLYMFAELFVSNFVFIAEELKKMRNLGMLLIALCVSAAPTMVRVL